MPPQRPPSRLRRRAALADLVSLAACGPTRLAPLTAPPRGRVVVLRGLFNMFSTGMNFLTARLRQADFDATVHNHLDWRQVTAMIQRADRDGTLLRPFAIIGHSYGADDAVAMANRLSQAGVVTDLLVPFDVTVAEPVTAGTLRVLNFYQDRDTVTRTLVGGPGFTGVLENRLVPGESHVTIDKQEPLHLEVVALMQALATEREARAARPMAPTPRAAPPPVRLPLPVPPAPPVRARR